MGTKNNPSKYDCYDKADPDEPMFVLLARDRFAPAAIRKWVAMRVVSGRILTEGEREKLQAALECAFQMEEWRRNHDKGAEE